MMRTLLLFAAFVCLDGADVCAAQNALSNQGFGYPVGGLSTRSLSSGGSTGEADALSALNPAALINWGRSGLAAQFAPELRSLRGPSGTGSSRTMRFPMFAAGINVNDKWILGASSTTLLDRTWSARFGSTDVLDGQEIQSTTQVTSLGGINDVRLAVARRVFPALSAGVGFHLISGANDIAVTTDYSPSDILDASLRTTLGFSGTAWSAGLLLTPHSSVSVGLSARMGGTLSIDRDDAELSSASVPDRYGASLLYTGIRGALFAASYESVAFSQMNGLGSEAANARDTRDVGVGTELPGPSILRTPSILRIGARWRDLPFDAQGAKVSESSYSAGLGMSVAGGRALFDLGVVRVLRDNNSAHRESAWIITSGILIRP